MSKLDAWSIFCTNISSLVVGCVYQEKKAQVMLYLLISKNICHLTGAEPVGKNTATNMATNSGETVELQCKPVNFLPISNHEYLHHLSKEVSEKEQSESFRRLHIQHQPQYISSRKTAKSLPELQFGNVYIHLVNPSPYTAVRMKAYKRMDSY